MRVLLPLIITGLVLLGGCESRPSDDGLDDGPTPGSAAQAPKVSVEELLRLLAIDDEARVVEALNDVKRRGVSPDGLLLIEAVWLEASAVYPDLAWSTLMQPMVRLNLVDILVQAASNGELRTEPADAHEFVRTLVRQAEPRVVSQGLITLALFDSEDDVSLIEELAGLQDEQAFRSAVIALSMMCSSAATQALSRLEVAASESNRVFTRETSARMRDYKARTGQCQ